jgi:hypothetical protein
MDGKNTQVAIWAIAPITAACPAREVGGGATLMTTTSAAMAPISPMAPIVWRNFSRRRKAAREWVGFAHHTLILAKGIKGGG